MVADSPWESEVLGDLAEITVGFVGSMASEYVPAGVPFLRSLNVRPFRIDASELMHISDAFNSRIAKSALKPGDVVVVRTGTPGVAAVMPDWLPRANCADLVVVRPGPRLDPRFLAYYINGAAQGHIDAHVVGAVQQHYNIGSAKQMEVALPSVAEQRAISTLLGALDDKIDLNRRMNQTLEEMASALFRSWFVDFDPVAAKAAGRQPFGMDAATAALFPSSFEDSVLGPIPRGWRPSTIGAEVGVRGGSTPRTKEPSYWHGGQIAWLTPRDLSHATEPVVTHTDRSITALGLEQISSGLLPRGSVLLSSRAPIGYLAVADVPLAVNQGFIAMVCDGELTTQFVRQWTNANMDEILSRAGGTTFPEISKQAFRPIPVLVPSPAVVAAFAATADAVFAMLVANVRESRTLAALRDTLLPKLLSGEIRLRDAERAVAGSTA